jgi:hypothetical protein
MRPLLFPAGSIGVRTKTLPKRKRHAGNKRKVFLIVIT